MSAFIKTLKDVLGNQLLPRTVARAVKTDAGETVETALARKAPAGFGYGECKDTVFWDDVDGTKLEQFLDTWAKTAVSGTVTRFKIVDYPACIVSGNGGYADVYFIDAGAMFINYYAMNLTNRQSMASKQKSEGRWYPWEYVNPPMLVGVEYRTTERYLGIPVYAKTINFGALPNATVKIVEYMSGGSNGNPITCYGYAAVEGNRMLIPSSGANEIQVYANSTSIFITTVSNLSASTAYITVKYTKT